MPLLSPPLLLFRHSARHRRKLFSQPLEQLSSQLRDEHRAGSVLPFRVTSVAVLVHVGLASCAFFDHAAGLLGRLRTCQTQGTTPAQPRDLLGASTESAPKRSGPTGAFDKPRDCRATLLRENNPDLSISDMMRCAGSTVPFLERRIRGYPRSLCGKIGRKLRKRWASGCNASSCRSNHL